MSQFPESIEIHAKRALLKEQTQLLGERLSWLYDPSKIPAEALGKSTGCGLPDRCFSLATWVLIEVVLAANSVQQQLSWEETFAQYEVPSDLQSRILSAVLEPTSRHAPGIFAMSEIVAAIPMVATRESVPVGRWGTIARKSEKFGVKISCDGSDLQVLVRNYLRRPSQTTESRNQRVLDAALLRLDEQMGITSVTPIDDLVSAAKVAITEHIRPARGICVAMLAKAPACEHASALPLTMYGAIWSAYTAAADRLIFQNIDLRGVQIPSQARPDSCFEVAIDTLARHRAAQLHRDYPATIWHEAQDEIKTLIADHARTQHAIKTS